MRITSSMMMNKYQKTLEDNLTRLSDDSDKVTTERNFTRASQDPVAAMKALKTSQQLSSVEQYQQSVKETGSWVTAGETAVTTIGKILQSADETILAAKNGTNSDSDSKNYAAALKSYQSEMLQALNTTFNSQYVFGGSQEGKPPFKVASGSDSDIAADFASDPSLAGKLLYYDPDPDVKAYIPLSAVNNVTDPADPSYKYSVSNPDMNYSMPVDLGMGMKVSSHTVVTGTAFDAATSPLSFMALNFYTDTSKTPPQPSSQNLYDALGTAVATLNSGNTNGLDDTHQLVADAQNAQLKANVVIGEKSKMLDFLSDKLTNDNLNLTTRLSSVEDADITLASTNYAMSQMVYNASLSISSSILQHSLIDFLK